MNEQAYQLYEEIGDKLKKLYEMLKSEDPEVRALNISHQGDKQILEVQRKPCKRPSSRLLGW